MDAARLSEIDSALASFGKSDAVVADVIARARRAAPREDIDRLFAELGAPMPRIPVESLAPAGLRARPAEWNEPVAPVEIPDDASGVVDVPDEALREHDMPAVLAIDVPSEVAPRTERPAEEGRDELSADALFEEPPTGTTDAPRGPSLDELFDDVRLSSPDAQDLSDIIASEPPPPPSSASRVDIDEPDATNIFTAEEVAAIRSSMRPPPPPAAALDQQLDELVGDVPETMELAEMPLSGDFELLVDDDVLVLDDSEPRSDPPVTASSQPPPPPPATKSSAPPESEAERSFFSRLLNRK